ncbi:MAG: hypothetical protein H0V49_05745 [Nocardioidaceae bacterium]|nr:hypothetical protein [Nocardioidaceae bacterium]
MSSVVRPSGPLPPNVYWARRLALLVVLGLVVALVWWFLVRTDGDGADPQTNAGATSAASMETGSAPPETSTDSVPHDKAGESRRIDPPPSRESKPGNRKEDDGRQGRPGKPERDPRPQPTGECEAAEVGVEVEVDDAQPGKGTSAQLRFVSEVEPACTLAITADSLALRVVSGSDTVWTSQECPDSVLAEQLVVRQDRAKAYTFNWDGKRSVLSCQGPGEIARAGGYWLEAALVGAGVERAYFEVA